MASAPQAQGLPLFYNDLQPLSSELHSNWRIRQADSAPFMATQHAIPLTADEFTSACRFFPIIFSAGDNPVPLALLERIRWQQITGQLLANEMVEWPILVQAVDHIIAIAPGLGVDQTP